MKPPVTSELAALIDERAHLAKLLAQVEDRIAELRGAAQACWCGCTVLIGGTRYCRDHQPRCPSGAHWNGWCMCRGI